LEGEGFLKKMIPLVMAIFLSAGVIGRSKQMAEEQQHASHIPGEPSFMHIYGLGYSNDGKRLLVPAHKGLKIFADGKWMDSHGDTHDYMGFSMTDDGFYSSGHPAMGASYKDPMGLVKSKDDGKSISVLALEGEVDLHGLSVGYRTHTLYALNSKPNSKMMQAGMFYSRDEAKSWTQSHMAGVTGQISTVSVHPTQESIVAVGTASGAYLSKDYGQTFTGVNTEYPVMALTFMDSDDLLVGTAKPNAALIKINAELSKSQSLAIKTPIKSNDMIMYVSENPANAKELTIATENRDIYISADKGVTWRQIVNAGKATN
jgi:phosphoribosyl-AMP cyclohydrolase